MWSSRVRYVRLSQLGRREAGAGDHVRYLVMQARRLGEEVVLRGAIGLADQAVERGAAQIPGAVQRHVRAHPAVQPVDAGEAVEAEQVGIGEFEVEAVLVRILVELAVAGLRCDDDLRHRLDELGAPGAGIAHERPAEVERGLRQGAGGVGRAVRAEIGLLVEVARVVAGGVVVQRDLPQIAERADERARPVHRQAGAPRVRAGGAHHVERADVDRQPSAPGIRRAEIAVLVARQDERQLAADDRVVQLPGRPVCRGGNRRPGRTPRRRSGWSPRWGPLPSWLPRWKSRTKSVDETRATSKPQRHVSFRLNWPLAEIVACTELSR